MHSPATTATSDRATQTTPTGAERDGSEYDAVPYQRIPWLAVQAQAASRRAMRVGSQVVEFESMVRVEKIARRETKGPRIFAGGLFVV